MSNPNATNPENTDRGSRIESELKRLSIGGAALFLTLSAALVAVLSSLGSQLLIFQDEIVPAEQAVGRMLESMGDAFDRETAVLTATDTEGVDATGDNSHAQELADSAIMGLGRSLDPGLVRSLESDFESFLASAKDLTVAVREGHSVNARFSTELIEAQRSIAQLLAGIGALEGQIQLQYVLLLRELDTAPSPEAAARLVHGDVRMLDERVSAARTEIEVLGRRIEQVALTRDRDGLNGLTSNELAQAAAGATSSITHLAAAVSGSTNAALEAKVATVSSQLEATIARLQLGDLGEGLIPLRHAYFDAQATTLEAQASGRDRSASARGALTKVGDDVGEMVKATEARVASVVSWTRIGVLSLVILGLGACGFSARRILRALGDLRQQNADLAQLKDELSEANATLELRVEARTAQLAERETQTRLLLDSMGDGLFKADSAGNIVGERSKATDDWFGDRLDVDDPKVWDVLSEDSAESASVQFGWDQLADGFLPFEVAADQMPRRFERDGRVFDVEYRQGGQDETILVVVRDWTANEAAERAEAESREFQILVGNLLRDRRGFELTHAECEALLEELAETDSQAKSLQYLHTLKGNTASFGFARVAENCHVLETVSIEENRSPSEGELEVLQTSWNDSIERLQGYLESDKSDAQEVQQPELERLRRYLSEAHPHKDILQFVETWNLTPARTYLDRLERQAARLSASLAKDVKITVEDNGVRVPEWLSPVWAAMVHAVRNSADHGIETPEARLAANKDATGQIALSVNHSPGGITIEITDDGAGVDEESLRSRLEGEEAKAAENMDLAGLLRLDGLSSKEEVTEISGRGVGISALVSTVENLGGTFFVKSTKGQGTSMRFVFPFAVSDLEALAA